MLSRLLLLACVVFVCSLETAAQQPTPSPTPKYKLEMKGAFIPEPVPGKTITQTAAALDGTSFKLKFDLPDKGYGWYSTDDLNGGGKMYLIPSGGDNQDFTLKQYFNKGPASSYDDAVEKVRTELKQFAPIVEFIGEEDFTTGAISGHVFGSATPFPHHIGRYTRTYVFTFNNAVFRLDISAATKDRIDWTSKKAEGILNSLRVK